MKIGYLAIMTLFFLSSCVCPSTKESAEQEDAPDNQVLTHEERERLTPDDVIKILKEGNNDFVADRITVRNTSERVRDAIPGQYPKAVILSCLDSRVPVEDVFHRGIGDIFVARVAGNIVNEDMLGSMEYACKVSGSKLVVILGHDYCGAIKSAINDVRMGNITTLLAKIKPAIESSRVDFIGAQTSSNPEFVEAVCHANVENVVREVRIGSPILKEMEDRGEIKIVGAIYDMDTGVVAFFEDM